MHNEFAPLSTCLLPDIDESDPLARAEGIARRAAESLRGAGRDVDDESVRELRDRLLLARRIEADRELLGT